MKKERTEQEQFRFEKLAKLKELNVDPFGGRFVRTDNSASIKEKAANLDRTT